MASHSGGKETRELESVLKNRPDSLLFARLADAYRKEGNIEQAIGLCVNGLNSYPYYTTGRILLGRCYLEQQKYSEAIDAFSAVCAIDRRNQVAIKMLADIFIQQGMEQRAGDLYALLLKMDPGNQTLERLCSHYASSGGNDIFSILGLQISSEQATTMQPAEVSAARPRMQSAVMDYTVIEGVSDQQPGPSQSALEETLTNISSIDEVEPAGDVSGADVSDRMSALFGEREASGFNGDDQQPGPSQSALEETLTNAPPIDEIEPADGISGTDVSDRMSALFGEREASGFNGDDQRPGPSQSALEETLTNVPSSDEIEPADGISGTDVTDRMSLLFGEQEASVAGPGKANFTDEPSAAFSDAVGDSIAGSGASDVSGTDISNRIEELFNDNVETATHEVPKTSSELPGVQQYPAPGLDGAAEASLSDLDFDLKGFGAESPEGTKDNRELSSESTGNFDETVQHDAVDFQNAADTDSEHATALSATFNEPAEVGDGGVSGNDISGRLEELFSDNVPTADERETGSEHTFDENSIEKPVIGDGVDDVPAFGVSGTTEDKSGQTDNLEFPAPADEPAAQDSVSPGMQFEMSEMTDLKFGDNTDELFINGQSDRDNSLSDIGLTPTSEATAEPDLQLDDFPDMGSSIDFFNDSPQTQQASDATGGEEVSGADIADRIEEILEVDTAASPEESKQSDRLQEENESIRPKEDSQPRIDRDEIIFEDSLPSMMQAAPRATDDFYSDKSSVEGPAGGESTGSLDEKNFEDEDPEFAETMQFDGKLFEQMLNPSSQDALFMEDLPAADDVTPDQTVTEVTEGITPPVDPAASEPFDEFELIPTGHDDFDDTRQRMAIPPEMPPAERSDDVDSEQSFYVFNNAPDERSPFEVTTEQTPAVVTGNETPDLLLDSTGTFEVHLQEEEKPALANLVLDANETDTFSEKTEYADQRTAAADLIDDSVVSNRIVSDNTEVFEAAPSGDDVAGQLDLLFPDKTTDNSSIKRTPVNKDTNNDAFAGELLMEADSASGRDDEDAASEDAAFIDAFSDDAAFIETMQMSKDDLTPAADTLRDESVFEVQPVDGTASVQPVYQNGEEQVDGPPVISGSDVKDRLEDLFPATLAPDLLSLSSENAMLPDDGPDEVKERVSDFYTIAGEDASQGMAGELPERIADVEFDLASVNDERANGAFSADQSRDTESARNSLTAASPGDDVLPEVELYEECLPEEKPAASPSSAAEATAPPDKRDKPFDIPEHVLTPTLADIYYQQGQLQLAQQIYARLLDRDPDNDKLTARLREIQAAIDQTVSPESIITTDNSGGRTPSGISGRPGKKKPRSDKVPDTRPLAGVRIRKRVNNAKKAARKKK